MTTFPSNFYNIHNLLELRVENLNLNQILSHFLADKVDGTPDLTIKVGKFDLKPTHSKIGRFHLGQNVIIERRKFGSMQLSNMLGDTELSATRGYVKLRPFLCLIENIIELKLLTRNHALIHSSCISEDGKGYLVCGWQGIGKTLVTVKLVKERGLDFLSDDLTVTSDSGQAYCFPKDIELTLAHTKEFKFSKTAKLKLLLGELVRKVPVFVLNPKRHRASVTELVENSKIANQCRISKAIMLQHAHREQTTEIGSDEFARRLTLLRDWALTFWADRLFIPYAYCDPKFDLHNLQKKECEILQSALKSVPCYEVRFRKFAYDLVKELLVD